MNSKIPVSVLGATGTVGQRLVSLLVKHPWFEVVSLTGSRRSAGKAYAEAVQWQSQGMLPPAIGDLVVRPNDEPGHVKLVFSALPSAVALEIEPDLAARGFIVCSNASAMRMEADIPLLIPEINADHLALVDVQRRKRGWQGFIVSSPNCSTTGIALALHPLQRAFGLSRVHAVTMQAISGAGYPGVASMDIHDNVIPHIEGEQEKIESETRKLLGSLVGAESEWAQFAISAQVNRVPVSDGHLAAISVELAQQADINEVRRTLSGFQATEVTLALPSAPKKPLVLREEPDRPQPRRDRELFGGMAVSIGGLQACPVLDYKFVSLVHNTLRGAAGGAILNAELVVANGYIEGFPWFVDLSSLDALKRSSELGSIMCFDEFQVVDDA